MLEMLGEVYRYDAEARDGALTAEERLWFHKERSGPVMEKLHGWLEAQFAERKTEPNSGLGKAITYLLRHWKALTTFLREAGAPLDKDYASYCTSSIRWGTTSPATARFDNLTPIAFRGGLAPGCSYKQSFLPL